MCDYSLFEYPNRLALEDEDLVTYRFRSRTLGFVSPVELAGARKVRVPGLSLKSFCTRLKQMLNEPPQPVAVCVPHGARLRLEDTPEAVQACYGVTEGEEVTFVQTTAAANVHRDAIRFSDGRQLLLQLLPEDLKMRVLRIDDSSDAGLRRAVSSEAPSIFLVGVPF